MTAIWRMQELERGLGLFKNAMIYQLKQRNFQRKDYSIHYSEPIYNVWSKKPSITITIGDLIYKPPDNTHIQFFFSFQLEKTFNLTKEYGCDAFNLTLVDSVDFSFQSDIFDFAMDYASAFSEAYREKHQHHDPIFEERQRRLKRSYETSKVHMFQKREGKSFSFPISQRSIKIMSKSPPRRFPPIKVVDLTKDEDLDGDVVVVSDNDHSNYDVIQIHDVGNRVDTPSRHFKSIDLTDTD